jgi:hypothetical protein
MIAKKIVLIINNLSEFPLQTPLQFLEGALTVCKGKIQQIKN